MVVGNNTEKRTAALQLGFILVGTFLIPTYGKNPTHCVIGTARERLSGLNKEEVPWGKSLSAPRLIHRPDAHM